MTGKGFRRWWLSGMGAIALGGVLSLHFIDPVGRGRDGERGALPGSARPARPATAPVMRTLGHLPLRFEANAGQFDEDVSFVARGLDYALALTGTGAAVRLRSRDGQPADLRLSLVGARPPSAIEGRDPLAGVVNYIHGADPALWRTGVGLFSRVHYRGVYDGIDLEYYGNQDRLEYDFVLQPGRDPRTIRLRFEGAARLDVAADGDLLVHVDGGEPLRQQRPVAYQSIGGVRRVVESRYTRLGATDVGIEVGAYDRTRALVIDPVLIYSSFFGGGSQEFAFDIALDPAGNIYLTGRTQFAGTFPTTPGAFQPTRPGGSDAFVAKFNPSGSALIYSTFLGGTADENTRSFRPGRIAADTSGNAYVTGDTSSADFPVSAGAYDPTYGGGVANPSDAFYVKLGPTGSFLYGTYIGGTGFEHAVGIGLDGAGNVYVAGSTLSDAASFPQTANAYDAVRNGYDAFLTKFSTTGTRLYSTFFGGTGGEFYFQSAGALAVDDQGRAYLAGDTYSTDLPIVGGYQAGFGGGNAYDAFLAVIDTTLSGAASLVYSTYLGGTGTEIGNGVAWAGGRQAVIVGEADAGLPTVNALDPTFNGGNSDAFVARFDTAQTGNASLLYSTYLGGADYDYAWDVAVDAQGAAHIVGDTRSQDFPLASPLYATLDLLQMFVTKIDSSGSALVYSTYFGGGGNGKGATGVAVNAAGDTFVAGHTNNDRTNPSDPTGHPITNPFQGTYGGGGRDAFVARIGNAVDLRLTKTAAPEPVSTGGTLTYTLTLTNLGTDPAYAVTVADPLPVGVSLVSCVATGGGVCGGAGNDRTVAYTSLAGGAASTITIVATVTAGMGSTLVNTAAASSISHDPNPANNVATVSSHTPGVNPNDTDNDALPNDWEARFGLDPNSGAGDDGPNGNPDADGRTNLQEYNDGSHPRGFVITYLAEGATGAFFDTRLALANPTGTRALVLARYQKDDGTVVSDYRVIPPNTRLTIDVDGIAGMGNVAFSSLVEADVQVIADRTMTWGAGGYGSHAERGVLTRSATTWYLAEGATHGGFDLFYLIQNPGPVAADVEVTYLLPAPRTPVVRTYSVLPSSRRTIRVDDVPGLAETDVSAAIRSTNGVPIIVERAMYFSRADRPADPYAAGHESAGVTSAAPRWFLAEGATGSFFNMFILLANPSGQDAQVQMDYLLTDGRVVTRARTVAANSRLTLNVAFEAPELLSANMSTVVTSTNAVPIVVERAMWWPAPGTNWVEAHNSPGETVTGTRWGLAEGESGGARGTQTYVLIANTSAFPGSARVRLLFEDGTTAERVFALPASSRTNVNVQTEYPAADNRRYGVLIESLGATPAELVVERAMYANANGVIWEAGTNALATRLP